MRAGAVDRRRLVGLGAGLGAALAVGAGPACLPISLSAAAAATGPTTATGPATATGATTATASGGASAAPAGSGPASAELAPVPAEAAAPPPLELNDLDGRAHTLAAYRGRVVIVNFWATWCAPCVAEMPSLQLLRERLGPDAVVVLGVNYGEAPQRVRDFGERMDLDYPLLLDAFHFARRDWRVTALPVTWVIDRAGRRRYHALGEVDWLEPAVIARIEPLVASQ